MYYRGCAPRPSLKLGSSQVFDNSQSSICVSSSWTSYTSPAMSRPGGGSWSWSDLANLQLGVGIKRKSGSSQNGEISTAFVRVDYGGSFYVILRPDGDVSTNLEGTVP